MNEENEDSSFHNPEDYKHKESLMEGQSMKLIKDSEKEVQEKLHQMKENTVWTQPKKIKLDIDNVYLQNPAGKESTELLVQQKRTANKLPAIYLKNHQIPDEPVYDKKEKPVNSDTWETMIIPLHNVNERGDSEDMIHEKEEEVEQFEKKEDHIKMEEEIKEENKEEKKSAEVKKPLKSILKKSREELKKIRDEERRMREEEYREREAKRKAEEAQRRAEEAKKRAEEAKLETMLKGIVDGSVSLENQNELLDALKNTKNSSNALENIKLLLEVKNMQNQHQAQSSTLPQMNHQSSMNQQQQQQQHQPQDQYYGSQPSKRVRLNPELSNTRQEEHNHYNPAMNRLEIPFSNKSANLQGDRSFNAAQRYSIQPESEYQLAINTEDSSAENQSKRPYKPLNYKTVPCRLFHSAKGCQFGDDCHYIHDPAHAGRETPLMQKKYARPFQSVNKNLLPNFKAAPNIEEPQREEMDIEPENFRVNPNGNFSMNHKPQKANFHRSEPMSLSNNSSFQEKPFRENLNHQPQRQNLHQNTHAPSFMAQQPMQRQPNRIPNQQFTPQSYKTQRDNAVSFDDFADSRPNVKDFSKTEPSLNRTRTQQPLQQHQQAYSPPQQLQTKLYNSKPDSYKAAVNVPPNPFISNTQQTEKPASNMKNYGNNMYKQNQQSRGPSFESTDTRRANNTGNYSSYPQRMQSTEPRSYPSQSQFRQNNVEIGGGFGHKRNVYDNRQYQDVRF